MILSKKKFSQKKTFFFIAWAEPWSPSVSQSVSHITLHSPNGMVFLARNGLKLTRIAWEFAFRWVFDTTYLGSLSISGKGFFPIPTHAFCPGQVNKVVCWVRCLFWVIWWAEFRSFWILMIQSSVRKLWTKNHVWKKRKGGTLTSFWVKKFFFEISIENDGKWSENDEYHFFMNYMSHFSS
jgi:hypothetical protein